MIIFLIIIITVQTIYERQFSSPVEKLCPEIQTEEATKNALLMPFIQLLGYDVFNPFEVNPDFVARLGIKKEEEIDQPL